MKKILLFGLLCLCLVLPIKAIAKDGAKDGDSYINGIDSNYPPFAYIDEKTGQAAGFDVDSLDWIAKTMGFKLTHKPIAWDGIIPALLAKQIDLIDSGMSITEKRRQVVDFSEPYWVVNRVFVVNKDSKLSYEEIFKQKISVGVQRGTSEAEAIKKEQQAKGYAFELRFYENAPLAIEDMLNGRIQVALMDQLPAEDSINKGKAIKILATHGEPDAFGVAMRKGDTKLMQLINEGYKKLKADPYWKELQQKYLVNK